MTIPLWDWIRRRLGKVNPTEPDENRSRPRNEVADDLAAARHAHSQAMEAHDRVLLREFERVERGPGWKRH